MPLTFRKLLWSYNFLDLIIKGGDIDETETGRDWREKSCLELTTLSKKLWKSLEKSVMRRWEFETLLSWKIILRKQQLSKQILTTFSWNPLPKIRLLVQWWIMIVNTDFDFVAFKWYNKCHRLVVVDVGFIQKHWKRLHRFNCVEVVLRHSFYQSF